MRIANKGRFTIFVLITILVIVTSLLVVSALNNNKMSAKLNEMDIRLRGIEDENLKIKRHYISKDMELKAIVSGNNEKLIELEGDIEQKSAAIAEKDTLIASLEKTKKPGVEVNRSTQEPREAVITAPKVEPIKGGEVREVYFEVTMYTNAEGSFPAGSPHYGTMANGEKTHFGAVAAPKSIPFGTQIVLDESKPGFEHLVGNTFVVKDRGGAIKQKTVNGKQVYSIDIYQPDLKTALKWGRHIVKGKIIG